MTVKIAPAPRQQFLDSSGDPYSGAQLFTYESGTSTKANTYTTQVGDVANSNPIVLDASGRTPYGVWLTSGVTYKFVLAPSDDTDPPASPIFTEDVISGTNDTATISGSQWAASAMTPTYVSGTQFTVPGDQTSTLDVGRRVQASVSAGTVYGHISVSAYTSLTTVTLVMDAGDALDAGMSSFNVGILSGTNHSVPRVTDAKWTALGLGVVGAANAFTADNTHTGKIIMSGKAIDEDVHTEAAHATTADIWAGGNTCLLSGGIVTFTDVADAPQAGAVRYVVANDAHVITDNAALEVDGNANYTCAAGDVLRFEAKTTSTFRVSVVSTGDRTPKTAASATVEGIVELATEAEVETGTDTARVPSVATMRTGLSVHGTVWTSTSGTSNTWGSIPDWVTEVKIMFDGVSLSGTDSILVRIGDSGGLHSTGYVGGGARHSTSGTVIQSPTTGFIIMTEDAANTISGCLEINLLDPSNFIYTASGDFFFKTTPEVGYTAGSVTLDTVLTQIQVLNDGSDTFDAGSVNIMYR